jgi:hypothetical protein
MLAGEESGFQVVLDLPVPDFLAHRHRVARRRAAHVVDEDVDTAEPLHAVVDRRLHLPRLGHVDRARHAGSAFLVDDGLGDVGGLFPHIDSIDLRPLARQQDGRCLAVPPYSGIGIVADRAGARHEDHLVLEAEHVVSSAEN